MYRTLKQAEGVAVPSNGCKALQALWGYVRPQPCMSDCGWGISCQLLPEIYEVIAVARIGALEAGGTKMVMAIGDEEGHILERV